MIRYAAAIFLSSFLLFQVQPLIGKHVLPWFGGSPSLWTTCMLFFQTILVAGYGAAHWVSSRLKLRRQAEVYIVSLVVSLLALPIIPGSEWKPSGDQSPTWRILGLLSASVGLPYLQLCVTSPLLQSWVKRTHPESSPYRLFALSNLASLLALTSYPFVVEPSLSLRTQALSWSWAYGAAALAGAYCAVRVSYIKQAVRLPEVATVTEIGAPVSPKAQPPRWTDFLLWAGLAACGSLIMLATTNQISQDIAVVPFLWILPLALYLITFILCFESEEWYVRIFFVCAYIAAAALACLILHQGVEASIRWQIGAFTLACLSCCMVCHGELARLKPDAQFLTAYYLAIAAGGACGGIVVGVVAPNLFRGLWEFHLGLGLTGLLILIVFFRDGTWVLHDGKPVWAWTILITGFCILLGVLGFQIEETMEDVVAVRRNFYGVLRVKEYDRGNPQRRRNSLMHGRIEHGYQYFSAEKRDWPTSYYGADSGVGIAILQHPDRKGAPSGRSFRIGVVGLGVGTLATYGRRGDLARFYEIDPEIVRVADRFFTYRKWSPARVEVVLGDARISMERERARQEPQQFDILAVDAFSGDAIPVHLLTRECFDLYWYHLKADGILAVHVSSRYLNLRPVIWRLASLHESEGMQAIWVEGRGSEEQGTDSTDWVLVSKNPEFLRSARSHKYAEPWPEGMERQAVWTDDYSNLYSVLIRK